MAIQVPELGEVVVDIAWGGAFFALLDAAAVGLEIVPEQAPALAALGQRITAAVAAQVPVVHPERPDLHAVTFTTFTGPPRAGGHGRNTTAINPGGSTARRAEPRPARASRSSTRAAARRLSTMFTGRIEGTATVGTRSAVRPTISGRAWLTGTHQLGRDPRDPLGRGFGLGDTWLHAGAQWPPAGAQWPPAGAQWPPAGAQWPPADHPPAATGN